MSVDTHTTGRKLEGYKRTEADGVTVLVDADLARLPVEIVVQKAGLFGRGVGVHIDGVDGAACPFTLI